MAKAGFEHPGHPCGSRTGSRAAISSILQFRGMPELAFRAFCGSGAGPSRHFEHSAAPGQAPELPSRAFCGSRVLGLGANLSGSSRKALCRPRAPEGPAGIGKHLYGYPREYTVCLLPVT